MKKFNKVITIEVSVDAIAQQLLSTISEDFKHRDLLAETIVGTALDKGTMSYIYSSLNGYTNEIDFAVGDIVTCKETTYSYVKVAEGAEPAQDQYEEKYVAIGTCVVAGVDLYAERKLLIKYKKTNSKGVEYWDSRWVNHGTCSQNVDTPIHESYAQVAQEAINSADEPVTSTRSKRRAV